MRLSELEGKEIVNIYDGTRLGVVGESNLIIDIRSGKVQSIILPNKGNMLSFWVDKQQMIIPWDSIKKIGAEVIVVELDQTNLNLRRYSG